MASPICVTVVLLAELAGLPSGKCALVCELKKAIIGVETATTGRAMLGDGTWFEAHRVDGRWVMVLESHPEQCASGGAVLWGAK